MSGIRDAKLRETIPHQSGDLLPDAQARDRVTGGHDLAPRLVSGCTGWERELNTRYAAPDVQVGATHAARADAHHDFGRSGRRFGRLDTLGPTRRNKLQRAHAWLMHKVYCDTARA